VSDNKGGFLPSLVLDYLGIGCSTGRVQKRFSRQDAKPAKRNNLLFSPNLAPFAPWNTYSTKIELFARSAIPQGEFSVIRFPKRKFKGKIHLSLIGISSI